MQKLILSFFVTALFVVIVSCLNSQERPQKETERAADKLIFTGSFYDTSDAYRCVWDFTSESVQISWEGIAEYPTNIRPEELPRFQFQMTLTPEESLIARSYLANIEYCHGGSRMLIGSGLSTSVGIYAGDKILKEFRYFSAEQSRHLAKRTARLSNSLWEVSKGKELNQVVRGKYVGQLKELANSLKLYDEAVTRFEASFVKAELPDWNVLLPKITATFKPFSWLKLETTANTENELPTLVSQIVKSANLDQSGDALRAAGRVLVSLDPEGILGHNEEIGSFSFLLDPAMNWGETPGWAIFPIELQMFFEEFIQDRSIVQIERFEHPYLALRPTKDGTLTDEEQRRLEFLETSGFKGHLLGKKIEPNSDVVFLSVFNVEIDLKDKFATATYKVHQGDSYVIHFQRKNDGNWQQSYHVDYKTWEKNGFRIP